jgi:Protein of unknown function (DUF2442)
LGSSLLNRRYRRRRHVMTHTVIECRAEGNYSLWLKFDDGLEGVVYLGDLVTTNSYLALSDEDIFSRVAIDPVSNAVTWTGGIRLEPEELYRDLAIKAQAPRH